MPADERFPGAAGAVRRHHEVRDGEKEVDGDERARNVGVEPRYKCRVLNWIRAGNAAYFLVALECKSAVPSSTHPVRPPCEVLVDDGHRDELLSDHAGQRQVRLERHSQHDERGDGRVEESVRQGHEEAAQAAPVTAARSFSRSPGRSVSRERELSRKILD